MTIRRKSHAGLTLLAALAFSVAQAGIDDDILSRPSVQRGWQTVTSDYKNFYSSERWGRLGVAFGVGGLMANTNVDQNIQNWYQDHIRSSTTDNLSDAFKTFGEAKYLVPLSLAATGIGAVFPDNTTSFAMGAWGQHVIRTYLVGGPAMFVMQRLTGGARPGERDDASHWRPFRDSNGVSGHAFTGAVPFIAIARMSDSTLVRYTAYAASSLTALSRINGNSHFASQAFLGWYMAYEATDAVFETSGNQNKHLQVSILPWDDGAVVRLTAHW
jgi:hypothetical protein